MRRKRTVDRVVKDLLREKRKYDRRGGEHMRFEYRNRELKVVYLYVPAKADRPKLYEKVYDYKVKR